MTQTSRLGVGGTAPECHGRHVSEVLKEDGVSAQPAWVLPTSEVRQERQRHSGTYLWGQVRKFLELARKVREGGA